MAYTFEPGDEVSIDYENEDGETKTLEGLTVERNTTQADPDETKAPRKAKLRTSKTRSGIDVIMYPDGTLRAKPRFNANGRGEDGVLKGLRKAN